MTISNKTFEKSDGSPLVSVLKAIRKGAWVLDYRRDEDAFRALWALGQDNVPTAAAGAELLKERTEANKTIILIDGDALLDIHSDKLPPVILSPVIPPDKFGRHLSALSWALCLTHRLWLDKKPAPSIVILDMRSDAQHDATVTDFFDLPSARKPSNIRWFKASVAGFDGLVTHITATPAEGNGDFGDIAIFAKRWKSALVEADSRSTHHDLNNAMGPILLAASIADGSLSKQVVDVANTDNEKRSRAAMLRAMQWVVKTEANSSPFKPIRLETERELRILLLDDQAADGWLPVLSHYLGLTQVPANIPVRASAQSGFKQYAIANGDGGAQVSLWYATSPDSILTLLNGKAKSVKQEVARLRFTEDVPSENNEDFDELMLLDLRLFGGDDPDRIGKEEKYLEKVANALQMATGSKPSWADKIGKEDFREKPDYLQALTGQAQLVSAVDFSYPVVVWSSTGQRKVMECLRDFRNIFTGLEKPRFDAYMSNADDLRIALNDACLWAEKQLRAASLFHELMALKATQSWELPANYPYAEVYIEEDGASDRQQFKVGALIAFYESKAKAEELHEEMGKPHFGASLLIKNENNADSFSGSNTDVCQTETTLAFCGKGKLPKKLSFGTRNNSGYLRDISGGLLADEREAVANKLNELLLQNDVKCMMVTSSLKDSEPKINVDPRYFFLLSDVLRVAFTLFLLEKEVRVFVATKRQSITKDTESEAVSEARDYFYKWGVLSVVDEKKVRQQPPQPPKYSTSFSSLNNHSALHAAVDAHSYLDGVLGQQQATLCGARGVTLSYKAEPPRPAHYEWQIFNNIIRNAGGIKIRGQICDEYEALRYSFPDVFDFANDNSWRHLHYYADEILEKDGRKKYITAGVVTENSLFDRSLSSVDSNKDSQLLTLSCARSTLQGKLTDAIESYASAIFARPLQDAGGNLKLRNFVGKMLATKLATKPDEAKAAYEALLIVADARLASRAGKPKFSSTDSQTQSPGVQSTLPDSPEPAANEKSDLTVAPNVDVAQNACECLGQAGSAVAISAVEVTIVRAASEPYVGWIARAEDRSEFFIKRTDSRCLADGERINILPSEEYVKTFASNFRLAQLMA